MTSIARFSLLLWTGVLLGACASTPGPYAPPQYDAVEVLQAMLLVEDNDEIEGAWHSDRIVPYFNFIPGSIFGTPDEVPFMPVTVDANLEFTARLSEWTMAADAAAEPLTDWNRENGLRIEPEETRVLRVGTFAHDTLHDESLGGSLVEIGREGYVVFIYVDRPCAITGDLITGGTTFSHEIYLGADGFHFIGLDGDDFLYAIKPENQLLFVTSH